MRNKRVLKVREDFYQKDINVGDVIGGIAGRLKIMDLSYTNSFGTFILCEYVERRTDEIIDNQWERRTGVRPSVEHPFEIVGTIHIPGYKNMLSGIGFYLKNFEYDEILGVSFEEAWNLLYFQGARNAEASSSHFQNIRTKLIDTVEGLPSLDSYYWKISAYDTEGIPFAPLTKQALKQLEKGMGNAVDSLVQEQRRKSNQVEADEDLTEMTVVSRHLEHAQKIVILSGAGSSTNSGIPDYRSSAESLWRKNPMILEHLNQQTFEQQPNVFWDSMYELIQESLASITPFPTHEALLTTLKSINPNFGHRALARLSSSINKDVTIVTQNIDGLDQKAGSENVIEMHGNIHECHCIKCNQLYLLADVLKKGHIPKCECGSILRPNVVFFGDNVRRYSEATEALEDADLILVVGTSMKVYPFNQLIKAKSKHSKVVFINGTSSDQPVLFDYSIIGDISKILHQLIGNGTDTKS